MMTGVKGSEESWITSSTHNLSTLMVKSHILLNFRGLSRGGLWLPYWAGWRWGHIWCAEFFLGKWFSFLKAQGRTGARHVHPRWQEWTIKAANRCSNHVWSCFCNEPFKKKKKFSLGGQSFRGAGGYPNFTDSRQQNKPISFFTFTERHLLLLITKVLYKTNIFMFNILKQPVQTILSANSLLLQTLLHSEKLLLAGSL